MVLFFFFFFSSRRRHTRFDCDWSSDVCSSDLGPTLAGIHMIGHDGAGFCFDNERPAHRILLQPARLATSLVTNGAWLQFMADGGYARPTLWLSDGWAA